MSDPKTMTFPDFIDYRYGDRGGWKILKQIMGSSTLSYEEKIHRTETTFRIKRATFNRWYKRYRRLEQ